MYLSLRSWSRNDPSSAESTLVYGTKMMNRRTKFGVQQIYPLTLLSPFRIEFPIFPFLNFYRQLDREIAE